MNGDTTDFGSNRGALSPEDQAEYDRLEAEERDGTEAESEELKTYATPWGLRPLKASEAEDLRAQGLAVTEEPGVEPDTSLRQERADMAALPVVRATEHRDDESEED